jgi:hypothetical protein
MLKMTLLFSIIQRDMTGCCDQITAIVSNRNYKAFNLELNY